MTADVQGSKDASTATVTPWWRDERKRGIASQALVGLVLVGFVWFMASNMLANQERLGVPMSFRFLDSPAGFQLSFATISVTLDSPISRILLVGALNTLFASAITAVLATVLGVIIGISRLSTNFLISRLAGAYIELLRNTPLLLQLVFWYASVVAALPAVKSSLSLFNVIFLNKKGLYVPDPVFQPGAGLVLVAFIVAVVASVVLRRWASQRQAATGERFPAISVSILLLLGLPALTSLALGNPVEWDIPVLGGFNFSGGLAFQPEVVALIVGLGLNSSAFIAEIIRGGIIAVSHGQTEAALALGLKPRWTLRLVVIPQAQRIIIPPMVSQYLNVVKNSTLAGFIGYPDLFSVIGTSQNQTGRAVECITILMLFYLAVSLVISTVLNWYNKRVALVER
ncbi:amino acid ABC transporter permease [Dongia sedimenti]|uniref:ABC transporter permease subunit n=1 Tax=Dongia sedimenti TaxID=3064282 RepID=A0ABU0YV36_9PROT|nr:ABC transporter permease subunit [Rhodospirillaceae bacterium R-7]